MHLVKDMNHWRALLNTVMSVQRGLFSSEEGHFAWSSNIAVRVRREMTATSPTLLL